MRLTFTLLILFFFGEIQAQNTVGLLDFDNENTASGFNLIYPAKQSNVYLINDCGQVVHSWEDADEFRPGTTAYLLPNGNLLKSKKSINNIPGSFTNGGAGGIIELLDWNNEQLYSITFLDSIQRAHHDICPLPNGNFLATVWERKFLPEILNAGRDTSLSEEIELWMDKIVEIDPILDSIVWEWHLWDHLIQDVDSSLVNFGNVSEHIEKVNINFDRLGFAGRGDFAHINSIDYNPILDQILLSSPYFGEIWIVDHSTSSLEASSSEGGASGKGGDLLFRWGNPRTYNNGDFLDQKLFFQHNAHWIIDPLLEDSRYWGMISLFNNRIEAEASVVNFLQPVINDATNAYEVMDGIFLPSNFNYTIELPRPELSHSTSMSSIQVLEKDNLLICSSQSGFNFEMNIDSEVVWSYRLPFRNGVPVAQGALLDLGDNTLFDIKRYNLNFPAFQSLELNSLGYLELNPDETFCSPLNIEFESEVNIEVYPNPFEDELFLVSKGISTIESIIIYDSLGSVRYQTQCSNSNFSLDLSRFAEGIYFLRVNDSAIYKIVK